MVLNYAAERARAEFFAGYSIVALIPLGIVATSDTIGKALASAVSVGLRKYILGLNARNKSSVSRETLVSDFVCRSIDPGA